MTKSLLSWQYFPRASFFNQSKPHLGIKIKTKRRFPPINRHPVLWLSCVWGDNALMGSSQIRGLVLELCVLAPALRCSAGRVVVVPRGAWQLKASLFLRVSGSLVLGERALSCTVSALDSAWRRSQMEKPCLEDVLWDIRALLFHCFGSSEMSLSSPEPALHRDVVGRITEDKKSPYSHWGSI